MLYWGFDLGDGESAVARVDGEQGLPEIVEIEGKKVVITAWAVMKNGEVRIGENAARPASTAIRSAHVISSAGMSRAGTWMKPAGMGRPLSAAASISVKKVALHT